MYPGRQAATQNQRSASVKSEFQALRPGDVVTLGTSRLLSPAMVVQYRGDDSNMEPYNKGVMLARQISVSEVIWLYPEGSHIMAEGVGASQRHGTRPVTVLERTGEKGTVQHRQADGKADGKAAGQGRYVDVRELPDGIQRALGEVGYRRKNIEVQASTKYQMSGASGDGRRSFVAAVDLVSGRYKVEWGAWGGANVFNPGNAVDLDNKSRPIPPNGAVVKGTTGGGQPVWAYILVPPGNMQALLPEGDADLGLSDGEKAALYAIRTYKSAYRKDQFRQWGMGEYGPRNPYVQKLLALGLVKARGAGLMVTTKGRTVDIDKPGFSFRVAFKTVHPSYKAAMALYDEVPMTIARSIRVIGGPDKETILELDFPWGSQLSVHPDTFKGNFVFFVDGKKEIDTPLDHPEYAARMLVSFFRKGPGRRRSASEQALDSLAKRARREPPLRAALVPLLRKARTAANTRES